MGLALSPGDDVNFFVCSGQAKSTAGARAAHKAEMQRRKDKRDRYAHGRYKASRTLACEMEPICVTI